jgi:RNase P/RNase MRP subunit p30
MPDLVFPKNNEEHLVHMAKRLGTKHVIFCYPLKDVMIRQRAKEVAMLAHEDLIAEFAVLVQTQQEVSKALSLTRTIVATAKPEFFEDKRVTYIINFESGRRDDFIHHRNSGLNQVFVDQSMRTDKTLLVNANQLLSERSSVVLGRMMQNNAMFKKYKPRVIVVSGAREPLEMRALRDLANLLTI